MHMQSLKEAILQKVPWRGTAGRIGPFSSHDNLSESPNHKQMSKSCVKCEQQTIVCCHVDVGGGGPDHHDQFCHVCLNPACDYAELAQHTVPSSMVTSQDQKCWFCGRDVFSGNDL